MSFEPESSTRLVFGVGVTSKLGALARELGARRALIVTDRGIVAAGHVEAAEAALREAELDFLRYEEVRENPTGEDVRRCESVAREYGPDLLIGFGGGSSIDVAKGTNFVLGGGGRIQDYWGIGKARGDLLPMIVVPTTAGTGTETQSFALIADEETHQKMACGDPRIAARVALLDPALTTTQPTFVTACTGLDAIGHAVETMVTKKRTEVSARHSLESFRLANESFPRVLAEPSDIDARANMLRAAAYAGIAIENSMLGAAHSMANPLTARHGVAHGQAVGLALPHVVRFNSKDPETNARYVELARTAGLEPTAEALASRLSELARLAGMPATLADCEIEPAPALAEEAARQWTANFNPREVGESEFRELFAAASS